MRLVQVQIFCTSSNRASLNFLTPNLETSRPDRADTLAERPPVYSKSRSFSTISQTHGEPPRHNRGMAQERLRFDGRNLLASHVLWPGQVLSVLVCCPFVDAWCGASFREERSNRPIRGAAVIVCGDVYL